MMNLLKALSKQKFTLIFVSASLILPSLISVIFTEELLFPRDNFIALIATLLIFLVLNNKMEINGAKKAVVVSSTILLSMFFPIILMIVFILSPTQKSHDKIMYEICLPELRRHYNVPEGKSFPEGPVDDKGWGKWWYQHLECEENVEAGEGSAFSENPVDFHPINQN